MDWSCESSDRGYVHLAQCCHSPEEHVCGWNCATEKIIGNMWICKSHGCVHVCDANCKQRIPYGPNEEICFVSRRVFPRLKASSEPRRITGKRGAWTRDVDHAMDEKSTFQRTLHEPKFVSAFAFARTQ